MTFRVQPAVITRICDGCRTESDPVDHSVLLDQGWTLAPGTPYDHPVTALDWCPNCTTIRSDLAAAMQRVLELVHNALLDTDAGMGYPHVSAEDILRALDGTDE